MADIRDLGPAALAAAGLLLAAAGLAWAGTTERVSVSSGGAQGDGESAEPVISGGGGGYVAFVSAASNFVPGDTNRRFDIFVRAR